MRYPLIYILLVVLYVSLDIINFKVLPFTKEAYAKFYKDAFTTPENYAAAFFVYTLYPLSIMYLTKSATAKETLQKGVVLGLTGYGLYHLTNGATFSSWNWGLAAWDTVWGMGVTTFLSWVAYKSVNV
jgi:uncharacterized membrane protein